MDAHIQKKVAFHVVKKLPDVLIGQTSRKKAIITGNNKTTSTFPSLLKFFKCAKDFFKSTRKKVIKKTIPTIPTSLSSSK